MARLYDGLPNRHSISDSLQLEKKFTMRTTSTSGITLVDIRDVSRHPLMALMMWGRPWRGSTRHSMKAAN